MPLRPPCRSRCTVSPEGRQHALDERLREPAVGYIQCPIEQPFGADADEDVGQLPVGLEVSPPAGIRRIGRAPQSAHRPLRSL